MSILWTIIIGLIGALARLIVPQTEPGGFIISIILGSAGFFAWIWAGPTVGQFLLSILAHLKTSMAVAAESPTRGNLGTGV